MKKEKTAMLQIGFRASLYKHCCQIAEAYVDALQVQQDIIAVLLECSACILDQAPALCTAL